MKKFSKLDFIIFAACFLILGSAAIIGARSPEYFSFSFAVEDGPIENASAIMLFLSSLLLVRNSRRLTHSTKLAIGLTLFYALLYFVVAGEEISWGQRIFGWQSGDFFNENNYQAETNLHNLVVGDMHLTTTIFAAPLSLAILCYLVLLPPLFGRFGWLDRLIAALAVPVPRYAHSVIALLASFLVASIEADRNWEVYECIFSLLSVSIFFNPKNPLLRD